MKGIYVAVASLVFGWMLVYCFAVGVVSAQPSYMYIWQGLGIVLACWLCGALLIGWARRFFYLGQTLWQALRGTCESLLTAIWRHGQAILAGLLAALVCAAIVYGAVITVTRARGYYVTATTAQAVINGLQGDMAVAKAKLEELEAKVKELTEENEALLTTVKKAARSGVTPNRGGVSRSAYLGKFECTAYNPVAWQCDNTPHITATGNRVQPGYTAAVDPRYWRFGTRFYVAGFGEVIADDTGSKVLGPRRLDLCVQDLKFAKELGRWWTDVWLIE